MTNMKPYDPEHKGEFCTRDGKPVTILKTDARGGYPVVGLIHAEDEDKPDVWTARGMWFDSSMPEFDLMCVIPKREARVITLDEDGDFRARIGFEKEWAGTTFREDMPDDISQEKARAVIEAARAVYDRVSKWSVDPDLNAKITSLRAALGDDA